jgi:hypothetical protein
MPYGVFRYNQIIDECYIISKVLHTSYIEAQSISVAERDRILDIINEENERNKESIEKLKKKQKR